MTPKGAHEIAVLMNHLSLDEKREHILRLVNGTARDCAEIAREFGKNTDPRTEVDVRIAETQMAGRIAAAIEERYGKGEK